MENETVTAPKMTKRERFLVFAEIFDAYRIVPRAILTIYGLLVYKLYTWYTSIETVVQTTCDATLLKILVDHGSSVVEAQVLACQVTDMVGGPTTAQTAFVTTVIGLATPLFAFYANTGRSWKKEKNEGS